MRGRAVSAAIGRFAPICAAVGLCALLANCSSGADSHYGVAASPRMVADGDPVPKGGGVYRVGAPYTVAGVTYYPEANPHYSAEGLASWYGEDFHGRQTANGEVFDLNGISAAHPTLPLPSYVRVTDLSNRRSLIVRVNDRGPYHSNRIIDLSAKAARLLGFRNAGTAWVRVEYVGRAPIEGSDDRILAATLRQDEPAPAPSSVRLAAAAPLIPATYARTADANPARFASATADDASPLRATPTMAYAPQPASNDDTRQILNGRGLY
jgi:rare lipoprotein A